MGFFGKLTKIAIKAAVLPVDLAKDVFTLGGGEDESATVKRCEDIMKDVDELGDD